MKTPRFLVLFLTVFIAVLTPRPAEARVEVAFDFFYDSLAPYGEWIEVADYGNCWRPTGVDPEWAPYADGYWVFTDAGWTWVSYEEFGGIVYHYGRWVRVEDEGWCWQPDYEWGPAWVSWRQSDDYVGWAPLTPEARWRPDIGIGIWVDYEYDIGPAYYNFCRVRDFGAPVLRPVIVNRIENVTIIRKTVNITNITYNNTYAGGPVIFNGGPKYAVINERSARRIPALKLVQNADFKLDERRDRRREFNPQTVGNQLIVTAPFVRPAAPDFLKPHVKKVITAEKVTRGWNGVKSEDVRREMRQEMQRQTKGLKPDTAPARPVAATELKVVPQKADAQAPVAGTKERRERLEKKERAADVTAPPATTQPVPPAVTTAPTATPPVQEERPAGKTAGKKGRGPVSTEPQKPVAGAPELKPFNPQAETAQPTEPRPTEDPAKMRGARKQAERSAEADQQQQQAEILRQREKEQAAAAERQKAQTEQERGMRKQAEATAEQQRQQERAVERQKMQAEQGRAARQQAEAAAQQQKQMESQQRAAQEAARSQAAERNRQQEQMESRRRQQGEQQAEQQQRRQSMEQQQQRGAQDAARQQAERAAGEQRQQREQMRQQMEAQRPKREAPRAPQVAPPAPTQAATPEPDKKRGRKDKDKD
jgi:hypothetical protein